MHRLLSFDAYALILDGVRRCFPITYMETREFRSWAEFRNDSSGERRAIACQSLAGNSLSGASIPALISAREGAIDSVEGTGEVSALLMEDQTE
jgi:hypothetical protein